MGTFHVIKDGVLYELREEPEGGFTISVPALPGCLSFGDTFEEAMTMRRVTQNRLGQNGA